MTLHLNCLGGHFLIWTLFHSWNFEAEWERERNGEEKTDGERDERRGCAPAFIRCVVTCVAASIYQPHFGGSNHILKCMTCISVSGLFQRTPIHCLPVRRRRRVPTAKDGGRAGSKRWSSSANTLQAFLFVLVVSVITIQVFIWADRHLSCFMSAKHSVIWCCR